MTHKIPVIAIFDIGKTNKKMFLFDEQYQIVWEKTIQLPETIDEDGDICEDIDFLNDWLLATWKEVLHLSTYEIKALNFSTYGASLVYVDAENQPLTSIYNYLKTYPADLQKQFYTNYGGEENLALQTASPVLASLNSGMQLYRLKYEKSAIFAQMKYALHLPQYVSSLFTQQFYSDITSIGCHTNLWNFAEQKYHQWIDNEKFKEKLAPILLSNTVLKVNDIQIGIGLHDSSAALIPYLASFQEPFVLLSTGTWCISLNPFNDKPLTYNELQNDCLCYLTYQGKPVKASRLFAGYEHEQEVLRLAEHFYQSKAYHKNLSYNPLIINQLKNNKRIDFSQRKLNEFSTYEEAYHQLMLDLMGKQAISTQLVLENSPVKRIFVDGGFSKNTIYMNLLAQAFPKTEVFAASIAQASALGSALVIHPTWNSKSISNDLIALKYYANI